MESLIIAARGNNNRINLKTNRKITTTNYIK